MNFSTLLTWGDQLFGTAGMRGTIDIVNGSLAYKIGNLFASEQEKWAVAWDGRLTSENLAFSLISGLTEKGACPIVFGRTPSPVAEFGLSAYNLDGLFIVTASHNPPQDNGIKVVGKDGVIIEKEKANKIITSNFHRVTWNKFKRIRVKNVTLDYIRAVRKKFGILEKEVTIDYGNGVTALVFPFLTTKVAVHLNSTVDGRFPGRESEPLECNLQELIQLTKDGIGIAFDGDGDRVALTYKGRFLNGDLVFTLAVLLKLKKGERGPIAMTIATTNAVKELCEQYRVPVIYTKVGAPYLARAVKEKRAILGGEEVGGVIWPEFSLAKDGMLTALRILNGFPDLETALEETPTWYKSRIAVKTNENWKERVLNYFEGNVTKMDGIRIDMDNCWIMFRESGTEKGKLRIYAESKDEREMKKLLEEGRKVVTE